MLTRFEKRQEEARRIAANLLYDYGGDTEAAGERVLALVNGQRWLERLVLREMHYQTQPRRRAA